MSQGKHFKGFHFKHGKLYGLNDFEYTVGLSHTSTNLYCARSLETVFSYYPPGNDKRYAEVLPSVLLPELCSGDVVVSSRLTVLNLLHGERTVHGKIVYFYHGLVISKDQAARLLKGHKCGGSKTPLSAEQIRQRRLQRLDQKPAPVQDVQKLRDLRLQRFAKE